MKIHCPRCPLETEHFSLDLIESGACPDCGGQVYFGPVPEGGDFVLGMLFEPGCNVAIPLEVDPKTTVAGKGEGAFKVDAPSAMDFETTDVLQLDEVMNQTSEGREAGEADADSDEDGD